MKLTDYYKTFSERPELTEGNIDGDVIVPVEKGGVTYKLRMSTLETYVAVADTPIGDIVHSNIADFATVAQGSTRSHSFRITNPTALSATPIFHVPLAATLTGIDILCIGGTSLTGHLNEMTPSGVNSSVCANDLTATAGTVNRSTVFTNASISGGNCVGWHTTSIVGVPTALLVTVTYTID